MTWYNLPFADLASGVESMQDFEINDQQMPIVNKTTFNNPPLPRTVVPVNPCNDPNFGRPSPEDKRQAKCTICKTCDNCYKLQERFLLIQGGIEDERDELMEEIEMMEKFCKETRRTLETMIENDKEMLENAQTKLAMATEKEANAGETARTTAQEHDGLDEELKKQMKLCSKSYIELETEICALKKIRGQLYKMKGGGHSAFFPGLRGHKMVC